MHGRSTTTATSKPGSRSTPLGETPPVGSIISTNSISTISFSLSTALTPPNHYRQERTRHLGEAVRTSLSGSPTRFHFQAHPIKRPLVSSTTITFFLI